MIGSRLVSLAPVDEDMIDLLGSDHFCLTFLLLENGVREWPGFVENTDAAIGLFAHGDGSLVEGIGRAIGLDLVDHVLELEGQVLGQGRGSCQVRIWSRFWWANSGRWASRELRGWTAKRALKSAMNSGR